MAAIPEQRVVAKALKVRKDKKSVELSIKSVSDERRRDTLQRWKNKQRASQLLRIVGERSGWDDAKVTQMNSELTSKSRAVVPRLTRWSANLRNSYET